MPNRIIKESACTSETLAAISADAERLWWRLIVQADDFGCFDGRPQIVLGKCLTAFIGTVTFDQVDGWLNELDDAGLIRLYEVDGRPYIHIQNWDKHQRKPRSDPKWPLPPPADSCGQLTAERRQPRENTAYNDNDNVIENDDEFDVGNVNDNEGDDDADAAARAEAMSLLSGPLAQWHQLKQVKDALHDFAAEMGWPVVLIAMQRTLEASTTRWPYCRSILNAWSERKVRSPTDVAALDAQFEAQKQAAATAPRSKQPRAEPKPAGLQRKQSYDDLIER